MNTQNKLVKIRQKKLGLLMLDARVSSRKTQEECAQAIGIPVDQLRAYERGEQAPSLPEIEALAFFLNIPLGHFWGHEAISENINGGTISQANRLNRLRQKIIGTTLRIARNKQNLSYKELCELTSIPEENIRQYENGEISIPLPELELLANALEVRVEDFFDQHGPIGNWRTQQQAIQKFLELSPEMQSFILKPVNLPYLTLATRLSDLSVEKLRMVAEALLEITY